MEGVAPAGAPDAAGFVDLCAEDEFWDGEMDAFEVADREVLLVRLAGRFFAYDGICPHQSVSLADGELTEEGTIVCGAHQWEFRADSGEGINPAGECLQPFPVRVEGGRVLVAVAAGAG